MVDIALADPESISIDDKSRVLGHSALSAAILWNAQVMRHPDCAHMVALCAHLRIPAERPRIVVDTDYRGALTRMVTRSEKLAREMVAGRATWPRDGATQRLFAAAVSEHLARTPIHD